MVKLNNPMIKTSTYVIAVVVLCVLAMLSVLAVLLLRPEADNTPIIASIFGFLIPVVTALLAGAVQGVQKSVNGRMTELLETTAEKNFELGKKAGREQNFKEQSGPSQ